MVVQCCVCKKVRQTDGSWTEQSVEGRRDISHGYCPDCFDLHFPEMEYPQ